MPPRARAKHPSGSVAAPMWGALGSQPGVAFRIAPALVGPGGGRVVGGLLGWAAGWLSRRPTRGRPAGAAGGACGPTLLGG